MAVTFYEKGSWKFCCAICGRTDIKSSRALKYWQGFYTCDTPGCWEQRNAQEFQKPIKDPVAPPWTQICGGPSCQPQQGTQPRSIDSTNTDEVSLG